MCLGPLVPDAICLSLSPVSEGPLYCDTCQCRPIGIQVCDPISVQIAHLAAKLMQTWFWTSSTWINLAGMNPRTVLLEICMGMKVAQQSCSKSPCGQLRRASKKTRIVKRKFTWLHLQKGKILSSNGAEATFGPLKKTTGSCSNHSSIHIIWSNQTDKTSQTDLPRRCFAAARATETLPSERRGTCA